MLKHHNQQYTSTIPTRTGDRYYAQDRIMDFRSLQDFIGGVMNDVAKAANITIPLVITGGVVSKGAGDTLDITTGYGYALFEVEIPDSFASTPPSKTTDDLQAVRVEWAAQNDMAIASATLNGSTVNYVKVAYSEADGNTRNRAKSSGSYAYETSPSYTITVDSTPPTDYEVCIASFTGTSGGAFTINNSVKNLLNLVNSNVVSEWASGTTYSQDDHVMYLGIQYVSMVNSNTGNIPMDNLDKWYPCPSKEEIMRMWKSGYMNKGGLDDIHDYRDGSYRQFFPAGKYYFSGSNGGGRAFQAWAVHADGTTLTGDADLEAIFDPGGSAEYHLIDLFAPDVAGTRTIMDTKGRYSRVVDGGGGNTAAVGGTQEDAMQRVTGGAQTTAAYGTLVSFTGAISARGNAYATTLTYGAGAHYQGFDFDNANSTSPNAAKTDDAETRGKEFSEGIPYIFVLVEITS